VRLYNHQFNKANPEEDAEENDFLSNLNHDSLEILKSCRVEPSLAGAVSGDRCQFERIGYFCVDSDSSGGHPVFNRTVTLKDTWARMQKTQK
jgi:glutaminyl-tRNA synthetase